MSYPKTKSKSKIRYKRFCAALAMDEGDSESETIDEDDSEVENDG